VIPIAPRPAYATHNATRRPTVALAIPTDGQMWFLSPSQTPVARRPLLVSHFPSSRFIKREKKLHLGELDLKFFLSTDAPFT